MPGPEQQSDYSSQAGDGEAHGYRQSSQAGPQRRHGALRCWRDAAYRRTMADRPRDDEWWLASDGKWYPPELASDARDGALPGSASPEATPGTVVPSVFTNVVGGLLTATSILMVVSSFFGLRYAGDLRSGRAVVSPGAEDVGASEITYTGWLSVALLM